jgi:hypothetical protein
VVFGADLGEEGPAGMAEEIDEEHGGSGQSLADGLGLPVLLEFDEEEIVAELGLGDRGRVAAAVLVMRRSWR